MRNHFWLLPRSLTFILTILLLAIYPLKGIYGKQQPSDNELLQHYLSIHEVEKELERVTSVENRLREEMEQLSTEISQQQVQMRVHKERAAKIARAYYMGDRNDLLILLYSATDLQQFLRTYDMVSYLFDKDQEHLYAFHTQVEQMRALFEEKDKQAIELDEAQKHLLAQKTLIAQLNTDLASLMSGLSDKEKIILLQKKFIVDWEERGIPAFDLFLRAISNSMSGMASEMKDNVTFSITGAKLTITDQLFTSLLQKQNELFKDFRISFEKGKLTFFGTYENIVLTMSGSYQLDTEELVRFHIEQLKYNGFSLPDSTAKALEEEYDLGIYPKQINERLIIKKVVIENGELVITFSLQL